MDVGSALAVAMEGGLLPWGDAEGALKLVQEIITGTENGRMIGSGAKVTGDKLGVKRVPQVKGQALSAYDPRILKGTGVTFATSTQGADHTSGIVLPGPHHPEYVPVLPTGQAPESRFMQEWMAAIDSLGYCMMIGMPLMEHRKSENLHHYAILTYHLGDAQSYPNSHHKYLYYQKKYILLK